MTPTCEVDLHSDSGYGRLSGPADDDVKGYGVRMANLLRRGSTPSGSPSFTRSMRAASLIAC
eukprot:7855916-Pyramimonas_sp.AAC.1